MRVATRQNIQQFHKIIKMSKAKTTMWCFEVAEDFAHRNNIPSTVSLSHNMYGQKKVHACIAFTFRLRRGRPCQILLGGHPLLQSQNLVPDQLVWGLPSQYLAAKSSEIFSEFFLRMQCMCAGHGAHRQLSHCQARIFFPFCISFFLTSKTYVFFSHLHHHTKSMHTHTHMAAVT